MNGLMWCITHDAYGLPRFKSSECLFVTCPPPEMEEDWEKHVVSPTPQEIHAMDLRATELVTSWA